MVSPYNIYYTKIILEITKTKYMNLVFLVYKYHQNLIYIGFSLNDIYTASQK